MRDEASRWLSEAKWDLETAELLYRHGRFNAACFYAQQAAEKAVKALLFLINEAPWGHSVRLLIERWARVTGVEVSREIMVCARELDRHYIPSRYPNALPAGTPHEAYDEETAKRALECARAILNYVENEFNRRIRENSSGSR